MRTTSSDGTSAVAGTPLDAAILSPERNVRGKLEIDWGADGFSASQYTGLVPSFDDTFQGGLLDPRWTLAGAGTSFDSVNHQVVLSTQSGTNTGTGPQVTTGGTSLTLNNNYDMAGATLRFKFTMPVLTGFTRSFDIYIVDRDTGDYWYFRNNVSGLYIQTYNASTVSPQSKFATWGPVNGGWQVKQIDLNFSGNYNPIPAAVITNSAGATYTALGFSAQFPVPPPRLNNCKIVMTAYDTSAGTPTNVTIQEVKYQGAKNTDDMSREASSLSVDRSLQGVLPAEVTVVEGSSTAQVESDLISGENSDDRRGAAWKLSPFNQNSPLYSSPVLGVPVRASVEIDTPQGTKKFQKMIGALQELDVNVNDGSAPITAYDYRYKLAGDVQLPAIDGDMFGLNATALIDYALATNGVNWGVPVQPGAQLWMPMHGSAYPMISGSNGTVRGRLLVNGEGAVNAFPFSLWDATNWAKVSTHHPFFVSGPFSGVKALMLGADALSGIYGSDVTRAKFFSFFTPYTNGNNDMFSQTNPKGTMGAWIKCDPITGLSEDIFRLHLDGPVVGPNLRAFVELYVDSSRHVGYKFGGTGGSQAVVTPYTLPTDGTWHWIGVSWDGTVNSGATISLNGGMDSSVGGAFGSTTGQWNLPVMPVHDSWAPTSYMWANLPVAEIQAYPGNTTDAGTLNGTKYIQTANLDYSTLELKSSYDTSQREAWGLINEIGATEFAATYFNEDGMYNYRVRSRVATDTASNTVQRTLDGKTAIINLKLSSGIDKVRNVVTANVEPVQIIRNTVIFSTTDTYVLPPNQKTRFSFQFQNPVTNVWLSQYGNTFLPVYPDNAFPWPDNGFSSYGIPHGMVCVRTAQSGGNIVGIPWPSIIYADSNSITMEFTNSTANTLYITNDGQTTALSGYTQFSSGSDGVTAMKYWGSPSLMLVGDMVVKGAATPVTYTHSYSVSQYGTQAMNLNDSQWLQDTGTGYGLVASVAGTLGQPVPTAQATIVGDPRLQLADRVKLQAGDFDGIQDNPVLNQDFWLEGMTDQISPNDGYRQDIDVRLATKALKFASAPTDTQYGFFDRSNTNKWDRYAWG